MNLFRWAHVRRHFVRAGDASPVQLKYWTQMWLDRIRDLYAAHEALMTAWRGAAAPAPRGREETAARLGEAYAAWDEAITVIDQARKKQMAGPGLQEPAKKALATLDREWDGLIAHRGHNGGRPPSGQALQRFLPWNASPEDLRTWAQPPPPA